MKNNQVLTKITLIILFQIRLFSITKGIVLADFSAKDYEPLEFFEKIAKNCNREIVVPGKQVCLLKAIEQVDRFDGLKLQKNSAEM
ncbi:MAG: hypothetical protein ACFFAN_12530 [Promethearchaeota archaeon]